MVTIIEIFKQDLKNICDELKIDKEPIVEINKNGVAGLLATTIALVGSKQVGKKPVELANIFKQELEKTNKYKSIEIAGPGFINVLIKPELLSTVINNVLTAKKDYGQLEIKSIF